jgi:hypothetical protein
MACRGDERSGRSRSRWGRRARAGEGRPSLTFWVRRASTPLVARGGRQCRRLSIRRSTASAGRDMMNSTEDTSDRSVVPRGGTPRGPGRQPKRLQRRRRPSRGRTGQSPCRPLTPKTRLVSAVQPTPLRAAHRRFAWMPACARTHDESVAHAHVVQRAALSSLRLAGGSPNDDVEHGNLAGCSAADPSTRASPFAASSRSSLEARESHECDLAAGASEHRATVDVSVECEDSPSQRQKSAAAVAASMPAIGCWARRG